jgi:mono/diheme cytochrome c family protein
MKKPSRWLGWPVTGLAALGGVVVLGLARPTPATSPGTQPAAATQPAVRLSPSHFGPIGYFETNCARCHGPYGSFSGPNFAKLPPDKLREMVLYMTQGPGNAPLDKTQRNLLIEYLQNLAAKRPFITLVDVQRTKTGVQLQGEVTPGTRVLVNTPDRPTAATVKEYKWIADLPADVPDNGIDVVILPP